MYIARWKSQSSKDASYVTPFMWHSGKGKITEMVKHQCTAGVDGTGKALILHVMVCMCHHALDKTHRTLQHRVNFVICNISQNHRTYGRFRIENRVWQILSVLQVWETTWPRGRDQKCSPRSLWKGGEILKLKVKETALSWVDKVLSPRIQVNDCDTAMCV